MTIVVDTTVLIDQLRGVAAARAALGAALRSDERVCASVLTKTETIAGRRAGEERAIERLFGQIEWIPVDDAVAERAGELAAAYVRSHPGIEVVDYVIAATVEIVDGTLWTRNRKHFPMFSDLPDPYADTRE